MSKNTQALSLNRTLPLDHAPNEITEPRTPPSNACGRVGGVYSKLAFLFLSKTSLASSILLLAQLVYLYIHLEERNKVWQGKRYLLRVSFSNGKGGGGLVICRS